MNVNKSLDQLALLKSQCKEISPSIYELNAHYLAIVRDILPKAIKTTLFSIITEHINDYKILSSTEARISFRDKIDNLIAENCSFLTIEYLLDLASEMEDEKKKQLEKVKQELIKDLNVKKGLESDEIEETSSIYLSSKPPVEDKFIFNDWSSNNKVNEELDFSSDLDFNHISTSGSSLNLNLAIDSTSPVDNVSEGSISNDEDMKPKKLIKSNNLFSSIFSIADSAIGFNLKSNSNSNDLPSNTSVLEQEDKNSSIESFLPDSPEKLSEWMHTIDMALIRRFRNLSHDINVELLRAGIVNTLIPVNLLEAILSGQIHSESTPSNMVRLQLPVNHGGLADVIEITCILLKPSDLEYDHLKLRKCRSDLKQFHGLLIKMMKKERYWQKRSLSDELSQEWWQTPPVNKPSKT